MADIQSTQTRPEFQYRFLALGISSQCVVHIIATTERQAREHSPDGHVMVFAGRLPA
ncbi:host cell division inhibitor Icd-like protein [Pectobacterium colocasium]|nr:host cell division inhibitor Icd-like protein [Pectobacterium colocasium]